MDFLTPGFLFQKSGTITTTPRSLVLRIPYCNMQKRRRILIMNHEKFGFEIQGAPIACCKRRFLTSRYTPMAVCLVGGAATSVSMTDWN